MKTYKELKIEIEKEVEKRHEAFIEFNDYLADHPEVSGREFETSKKIVNLLKDEGYNVEFPFSNIETAFKATYGKNNHKYKVAIMVEYDALPEIGHACGHSVSGSISLLAGESLKNLQDELNADIHLIGTPNEEDDGAKAIMVENKVFDIYDEAIMIHLYDKNQVSCILQGIETFLYTFHGKSAHASNAPWDGNNALNGAQLMLHAVDMLRQHVTPDVRLHAVYRNGGAAPNIVPDIASLEIFIRALNKDYLLDLVRKIDDTAKGAAIATQTTYEKRYTSRPYYDLKPNEVGERILRETFDELGIKETDNRITFGSSDAGNVSYVCPTFHPTLQIVNEGVRLHSKEFEAAVRSDRAHEAIALGAKVIALSIVKMFCDEKNIENMKKCFNKK